MGCDIYMWVEVRGADGLWRMADPKPPNIVGMLDSDAWQALDDDLAAQERTPYIWTARSYALFSALAGVRNYGGEITPISAPRGVPFDASPEFRRVVAEEAGDGHSHSWLTLQELLDHNSWPREVPPAFLEETLPAMGKLGAPEAVRMVFFFDN